MSLHQTLEKIKPLYTPILLIFTAIIFFALGRLSSLNSQKTGVEVKYMANLSGTISSSSETVSKPESVPSTVFKKDEIVVNSINESGEVIGSKSGKKYYFPWCSTVKRILPQNQVHFSSIEEAKKAGFTPGGNCKGLK